MISRWIEKKIKYDGSQLKPLYAYMNHGLHGDSVVSFAGPCDVSWEHMVDGEDLLAQSQIKSDLMLHFIVELFPAHLPMAVTAQRLFVAMAQDLLSKKGFSLHRNGDDLYAGTKKLSVSIASVSAVSAMIHLGINIENTGTPVETCSLSDFNLDPVQFAQELMKLFVEEMKSIQAATKKVRPL